MIRKFQKADTRRVMEIWLSGNEDAHSFVPREYWLSNFDMVQAQLSQAEVFVYAAREEIQGFIGMTGNYIAGLFVDEKYRSLGIGKRLLDYVKADHASLSLGVYRKNRRAVDFYYREGFSVQSEDLDNATGELEYTMLWHANREAGMKILSSGEADSSYIHKKLREYNARYMRDSGDFNFHIEDKGEIVAGIVAAGLGDSLEVEFLYVDERYRREGLGRRLLTYAETQAQQKGFRRVLLNTYSFQAPEFYKRLGYTELLKISPAFDGYSQSHFFKKL